VKIVRKIARFELNLYWSLLRWLARRPSVPPGSTPVRYAGMVTPILWVFIGVSALELVVLHLLLPWPAIRLAVDILSAWGLVWMFGLLASFKVYPHLAGADGLRIRAGFGVDLTVPWTAIAAIGVRERGRPSKTIQLDRDEYGGNVLNVVVGSRTNVDITLCEPLTLPLPDGPQTVTGLRFYADDPRRVVGARPAGTSRVESGPRA
jgi:hypothetical protein